MKVGDFVSTPYGEAKLTMYREMDKTYELRLPFGTLYASQATLQSKVDQAAVEEQERQQQALHELNQAYEALEKMRRLNLEVRLCEECGITPGQEVDYHECTQCLLQGAAAKKKKSSLISSRLPRLKRFVQQREEATKKAAPACLMCGAPSCNQHSSSTFRKEGICVCTECEGVFQMDFVVDCMTLDGKERRRKVDQMIDLYDRAVLLLKFASQYYLDEVIVSLESTQSRDNKINVGGSSAGIVSGVLGVAAAATIWTPAGPPLLIASLLLGTGATAVQTGTEVNSRFFSEPHKVADRLLATHGMLLSILTVTGTLRDAATRDHIRTDAFDDDSPVLLELQRSQIAQRPALLAGMTAGRFSLASAELMGLAEGATIARSARLMSRSGTAAMRTLRFARFAGGALAAATLLLEAKGMHSTVQSIRAGSPSEKAEALQAIAADLDALPTTADLDRECSAYLAYMEHRGRRMMEDEAVQLLLEVSKSQEGDGAEEEEAEQTGPAEPEQGGGSLIIPGEEEDTAQSAAPTESSSSSVSVVSSSAMTGSLLERIQRHKLEGGSSVNNTPEQGATIVSIPAEPTIVSIPEPDGGLGATTDLGGGTATVPAKPPRDDDDDDDAPPVAQVDTTAVVDDDDWTTMSAMSAASLYERIEDFKRKESS